MELIKEYTKGDYSIQILAGYCGIPVRGNAMASGDYYLDKEAEDDIIEELESGNMFAWCDAKVEITHIPSGVTETDYLGCCNCQDEADFLKLVDDHGMVGEAWKQLQVEMESVKMSLI